MIIDETNLIIRTEDDRSAEAIAFIDEVIEVCQRHGFAIGHEDSHGAFQVFKAFEPRDYDWFLYADEAEAKKSDGS